MNKQEYKAARQLIRDNGIGYGMRQVVNAEDRKTIARLFCDDHTDWLEVRAYWDARLEWPSLKSRLLNTTLLYIFKQFVE